jgi:cbb3-type cytochrome oxidase maturation protein
MSVLFVAVPVALLLASGALACFFWAVCRGQLDDLETPPLRMLQDDDGAAARKSCAPSRRAE